MTILLRIVSVAFVVIALFGKRWAYVAFILASLVYFPAKVGFHLDPHSCELLVPFSLAMYSFQNFGHEILFTLFFIVSAIHFSWTGESRRTVLIKAIAGSLIDGALIEIGEGISGRGHCRLRDLLPDSAGIVAGMVLFVTGAAIFSAIIHNGVSPGENRRVRKART